MDRSFEGLLFSLAIHAIFVWFLFHMPSPPAPPAKTEISLIEMPTAPAKEAKKQTFIEETHTKPKEIEDLKDTADFLSQFTKRVKKQIVARQNGPTRNSKPELIPSGRKAAEPGQRSGVAGMDAKQNVNEKGDLGLPAPGGSRNAIPQVVMGPSSIAQFVPGIEQGDFTALNSDQFTYYSFFARVNEQIRTRWIANVRAYMDRLSAQDQERLSRNDRQTVIEIVLTKTGEFSTSIISHSSGDRALDQTTLDAFKDAAPFLNPPQGMVEEDGTIHLKYAFLVRFRPPFNQF